MALLCGGETLPAGRRWRACSRAASRVAFSFKLRFRFFKRIDYSSLQSSQIRDLAFRRRVRSCPRSLASPSKRFGRHLRLPPFTLSLTNTPLRPGALSQTQHTAPHIAKWFSRQREKRAKTIKQQRLEPVSTEAPPSASKRTELRTKANLIDYIIVDFPQYENDRGRHMGLLGRRQRPTHGPPGKQWRSTSSGSRSLSIRRTPGC